MKLKNAGEDSPKYFIRYEVTKYCKIPLLESIGDDEKLYIGLKPKDEIKILWESFKNKNPIPKYVSVIDENEQETRYYFSWNFNKVEKWLITTTNKK